MIAANTPIQLMKLETYFGSPPLFADATLIFLGAVGVPVINEAGVITGCSAATSQVLALVKGINGGFGSNLGCDFSVR
ncbi:MAG: hypothetical protein H7222_17680 [Methylotenera sp.]|nr:hypothetical protein [Oligoflexia bacterium]